MSYRLVNLSERDREAVVAIYNHFVECGFAAFPEERVGPEFFDRLLAMSGGYPAVGVQTEAGETVGFALLRPLHPAATLRRTAELTYFILPEHTGRGAGRCILARFIESARAMGIDNLVASVSSLNDQSLRFHERAGFERCGAVRAAGRKFGRDFDVVWFQKRLITAPVSEVS